MPSKHLTNWRVKVVYHPHIVRELGEHAWSKEDAEAIVPILQFREAALRIRRGGFDSAPPNAALVVASFYGLLAEVEHALQRGADVNGVWEGWNPLTIASTYRHASIVELLLKSSAGPVRGGFRNTLSSWWNNLLGRAAD